MRILLLFLCFLFALPAQADFTVFGHTSRLPPMAEDYYRNTPGFGFLEFISQAEFTTADGLDIDESKLISRMKKFGTDSQGRGTATGYAVLDWEKKPFHDLRECPTNATRTGCFYEAETKFIRLITVAKKTQPKMKIGIYGLPFKAWNTWQKENYNPVGKLDNILSKVDYINPELYLPYPEGKFVMKSKTFTYDRARILRYFQENLDKAQEYGVKYNKPVIAYMWHRIWNTDLSSDYQLRFIQREHLAAYINFMKTHVSPNGGQARGVIMWEDHAASKGGGSEKYIVGNRGLADHLVSDMKTLGYDGVIREYARTIHDELATSDVSSAPVISFKTPSPEMSFTAPANVAFEAIAQASPGSSISRVEFFKQGEASPFATEYKSPYNASLSTLAAGSYSVIAKATDREGSSSVAQLNFIVKNAVVNQSKVVALEVISSETNEKIADLKEGDILNLRYLPTRKFSIRAVTSPLEVGSVQFVLNGNVKNENIFPYTMTGDDSQLYPIPWVPTLGKQSLSATPYSKSSAAGEKGQAIAVNFQVIDQAAPQVTKLHLINTDNNAVIGELKDGQVINLALLPSRNITIQALTEPFIVGSVGFNYDGINNYAVENISPYSISGDTMGIFSKWSPQIGHHTLQVTAFSDAQGSGLKSEPLSTNFSIIDVLPPKVVKLNVINTDTNQVMGELKNGQVFNLALMPSKNFTLEAITEPAQVGSVIFGLDGNSQYMIENLLPYSISGDKQGVPVKWSPSLGNHTVSATAYTEAKGMGIKGDSLAMSFSLIDQIPPKVIGLKLVDADTKQVIRDLKDGEVINKALLPKNLSIQARTEPEVTGSVKFVLDGSSQYSVSPYILNTAPETGHHSLKVMAFSGAAGSGVEGEAVSVSFSVINLPPPKVVGFTLINTDTKLPIGELKDGQELNLALLPTKNFSIKAITEPEVTGSVQFGFDGNANFRLENGYPYMISSNSSGTISPFSLDVGKHSLEATAFTESAAGGLKGNTLSIDISVINQVPVKVIGFNLINTNTNAIMGQLKDGQELNLALLPSRNFTIEAITEPSVVGSVQFGFDGNPNFRLENGHPYMISSNSNGAISPFNFEQGSHTVMATAFTERQGQGTKGGSLSASFNIIDKAPVQVISLTLINTDTNKPMGELKDGDTLNLGDLPSRNFSIEANTLPAVIGSVHFALDGNANFQLENIVPYSINGDDKGIFSPLNLSLGEHKIVVTPYTGEKGTGDKGPALTVNFKIVDEVDSGVLPPTTIPKGLINEPKDLAQITGKTYRVSSESQFNSAITQAEGGDGILIAKGEYNWNDIYIKPNGKPTSKALIIRSDDGPVIMKGGRWYLQRDNLEVQGLSFFNSAQGIKVDAAGSGKVAKVRMTMIHCKGLAKMCFYNEEAVDTRFDHSLVEESRGKSMHVSNYSFRTRIDHNFIRNVANGGGNGFEAIQIGHGLPGDIEKQKENAKYTNALVDHNILQNVAGEGEMIGIKTFGNKIVANVIVDSPLGHLSFRSGGYNLAYGNIFRKTKGGIRVTGFTPRVMQNLIVDPQESWEGIFIYVGSDTSYVHSNGNTYVETIAARNGMIRNNSIILTPKISGTGSTLTAMAERTNSGGCGSSKAGYYIACDVHPFNNELIKNVIVNDRKSYVVKLSSDFQSKNKMENNVFAVSGTASLAPESSVKGFSPASSAIAANARGLSDFVWSAPQGICLRITNPASMDTLQGSLYKEGSCESLAESKASAEFWLNLGLHEADKDDDALLMRKLRGMPVLVAPVIPTSR